MGLQVGVLQGLEFESNWDLGTFDSEQGIFSCWGGGGTIDIMEWCYHEGFTFKQCLGEFYG